MRQGPCYRQWGMEETKDGWFICIPYELVIELEKYKCIDWVDNKDGTYTLTPHNNV